MAEETEVAAPVEAVAEAVAAPVVELTLTEAIKTVLLKARQHDGLKRGLHEYVLGVPTSHLLLPAHSHVYCVIQVREDFGSPPSAHLLPRFQLQR